VPHEERRSGLISAQRPSAPAADFADRIGIHAAAALETYWRSPVRVGRRLSQVTVDWAGCNLATAAMAWPYRTALVSTGLETFGYENQVVFSDRRAAADRASRSS